MMMEEDVKLDSQNGWKSSLYIKKRTKMWTNGLRSMGVEHVIFEPINKS